MFPSNGLPTQEFITALLRLAKQYAVHLSFLCELDSVSDSLGDPQRLAKRLQESFSLNTIDITNLNDSISKFYR